MNDWSYIEHATDYLLRPRIGDPRHPTLWPSEATALIQDDEGNEQVVGKCRRASFFRYVTDSYKFYPRYSLYEPLINEITTKRLPPDRYMLWIWRAGELYEDYLINLAKECGVYIADQVGIYVRDSNISGKIDLKIINPKTDKYSNIEVKSVYGYGGNHVLGTPGDRKKGRLGTPRESNLMQIALYDWWTASADKQHEESRLIYGARDTGRYAEYLVTTRIEDDGITKIHYRGNAPVTTDWTESPITINSILEQYRYIQTSVDSGNIPDRDYELKYSEEKIEHLYRTGKLCKTDTVRHEKYKQRQASGTGRKIKPVVKGDWQCELCKFRNICYQSTDPKSQDYGTPKEL